MNKTAFYTVLAMLAFAGNSILCRLALSSNQIGAGSFTSIRLLSGSLALLLIVVFASRGSHSPRLSKGVIDALQKRGSWLGGLALFCYAAFFSYAYIVLDTATGALVLFGVVQVTMIAYGLISGDRPSMIEYLGFVIAGAGFVLLVWPELTKPSVIGLVLMALAGVSWAAYSVIGLGSSNPLLDTASNFARSIPFTLVLLSGLLYGVLGSINMSTHGVLLAVASGAITSGAGYALWYAALKHLNNTVAAVTQLSVPVLAAIFGVLFANEVIGWRLFASGVLVLGGILLVILAKRRRTAARAT